MEKQGKINVLPLDILFSLSLSVQDLFDAPAAEKEIEAFLNWLDESIGKVSSQEVLASSQAHGHVSQVLSQRGGGHGLGKRTLGVHGSRDGGRSDQTNATRSAVDEKEWKMSRDKWSQDWTRATAEVCFVFLTRLTPLLITSYTNCKRSPLTSSIFPTVLWFQTCADRLKPLFTSAVLSSPVLNDASRTDSALNKPLLFQPQTREFQ